MPERKGSVPKELAGLVAEAVAGYTPEQMAAQAAEHEIREAKRLAELAREKDRLWRDAVRSVVHVRSSVYVMDHPDLTGPAITVMRTWLIGRRGTHLLLRGGVGTSKTCAAALAVRHWAEPGTSRGSISWLKPDQLVSAVMHEYDPNSPKLGRNVVVDDVGTETKGDFAQALCDLLDLADHTVVLTANMSKKAFEDRYGERLLDRLRGTTEVHDIPGRSRRPSIGDF